MALEFKIASTKEEIDQALNLREVKETDEFDFLPVTTHFLAVRDGKPVGTVRLTEDSEKGLPIEDLTDLSKFRKPGKKLAKASKLFILSGYSSGGRTMLGLFKLVYRYAKKKGITDLYVTSNEAALPIFEKLNFEKIGEAHFYDKFNVLVTPLHLDLSKATKKLKTERPRLFAYFNK